MTWNNAAKSATTFLGKAISGLALWSDPNATWSDPLFTWGDIGIQYTNEPKTLITTRSFLPFGAWLFMFTQEADATLPPQWNYEIKH